eukprot:1735274-Rhodomonas_salina.1
MRGTLVSSVSVCQCACVRASVRACVRVRLCLCVCATVCVPVTVSEWVCVFYRDGVPADGQAECLNV